MSDLSTHHSLYSNNFSRAVSRGNPMYISQNTPYMKDQRLSYISRGRKLKAKRSPYLRIENKLLWYGPEPNTEPSWLLPHRLGIVQTISTFLVVVLVGHDAIYHFAQVIACHKYQSVVFPNTHRLWCDGTVNHKFECSAVPWTKKGSLTYNGSRRTPSSPSGRIPCRQPNWAIGTSTFSLVVRQIPLMPRRVQNWIKSIRSHKQVCATSVSSHQ